jgi:hypothetical protein
MMITSLFEIQVQLSSIVDDLLALFQMHSEMEILKSSRAHTSLTKKLNVVPIMIQRRRDGMSYLEVCKLFQVVVLDDFPDFHHHQHLADDANIVEDHFLRRKQLFS